MHDREFENYLALLSGMLRFRRTQREGIAGELRDHLVEHVAHLEASGIAHEEAVRRALEEFGDAAALAANFSALVGMRRRRLIMRCTIGTTVVMTGLVVAMLAFRPPVIDDPSIVQAQAGGSDSKKAKGKVKGEPGERIAGNDSAARQRLQNNKISAEFVELPVRDALAYISDKVGVQFYIDKHSLESANTSADTPTTLNLQSVPAEMVLDLILREAKLGYRLRNGVIIVGSAEDVQSQTEVRVCEIPVGGFEDGVGLAEELAALIPATVEVNNWSEHTVVVGPRGRRRAGYGSTSASGSSRGGYGATGGGYGATGYGAVEVREGESAESVGGGGVGTIRVFRGTLVISQTPEVHQRIEKLLNDLGATGALNPQRLKDLRAAHPDLGAYGGPPGTPDESRYGSGDGAGYGRTGYGQSSQPGYGSSARGGHGQPGYGQTGRGGYGATGGSRGGYGVTPGYGTTGPARGQGAGADRSGLDRAGYGTGGPSREGESRSDDGGVGPKSTPVPEGGPGQPPSSGGFTPVPRDPNASSNASPGPSGPGGQPPTAVDPAADTGTTTPPAGSPGLGPTGGTAPGRAAPGGVPPNAAGGESGGSAASSAGPPAGAYGGAR